MCLGMDEFNMIMSSCQPYIRSAHRCSRSAILRFNDVGIRQNDARDAETMAVSWLLFSLSSVSCVGLLQRVTCIAYVCDVDVCMFARIEIMF